MTYRYLSKRLTQRPSAYHTVMDIQRLMNWSCQPTNPFLRRFWNLEYIITAFYHGPYLCQSPYSQLPCSSLRNPALPATTLLQESFHHNHSHNHEVLLQDLCKTGHLDRAIEILFTMSTAPSDSTYMALLKACIRHRPLPEAKRVHAHLEIHRRNKLTGLLGGYLIVTLAKCGAIEEAQSVSDRILCRTVFTWTALIDAYAECGRGDVALATYHLMRQDNVKPNAYTFVSLFKACGSIPDLEEGRRFHVLADRESPIHQNVYVGTALLTMYEKCGAVNEAEEVFACLSERNVVSWNAMLSMYVGDGQEGKALQLYRQMCEDGVLPDQQTLLFAIRACGNLALQRNSRFIQIRTIEECLEIGHALHDIVRRRCFMSDTFITTALLKMYGKCGAIFEAEALFRSMSSRDIVAWTTMLTTYVEHNQGEMALELFTEMQAENVTLDDISIICILQACCDRGGLEICENIHFAIASAGCDANPSVIATLIHAYGNCMRMADARAIFDKQPDPDIVAWNACIAGYAVEGNMQKIFHMFEKLKEHIKPNEVTFISLLLACSHSGLVAKGLEFFESMSKEFKLHPNLKHYGIMIDLLGHKGEFTRLTNMLNTMPMQADLTMWLSLLDSCDAHGNVKLAERAFNHALSLQPKHATTYILMSKIYADAGLKENAAKIEYMRRQVGV